MQDKSTRPIPTHALPRGAATSLLRSELVLGVSASFAGIHAAPPSVELGYAVGRPKVSRRSPTLPYCDVSTLETSIGDESMALALVVEGYGGSSMAQYCLENLIPTFVHLAATDPSGRHLQKAGRDAFRLAHEAARGIAAASAQAGCTATLCAINRHRREVTTCNVGALSAVLVSRGRISTLTADHQLGHNASERQRLLHLGLRLAHAEDCHARPIGPLRVWPSGLATARAIGFVGAGGAVDPTPTCAPPALPPLVTLPPYRPWRSSRLTALCATSQVLDDRPPPRGRGRRRHRLARRVG